MIQFIIYFFAIIGAFGTGFYILNVCKWLFKDDEDYKQGRFL